jgi:hypothetical protein
MTVARAVTTNTGDANRSIGGLIFLHGNRINE